MLLFFLPFAPKAPGQVPGQEFITEREVEFDTPPSIHASDIGDDEYIVTIRWTPEDEVESPALVGEFNSWNRSANPFDGPDEEGTYEVSVRLADGEYRYKFTHGADEWLHDPDNPDREPDGYGGYNSILRLGSAALLAGQEAERGDGIIFTHALAHRPGEPTYFDHYDEGKVTIRLRALREDLEGAELLLTAQDGRKRGLPMDLVAHDTLYEFYEYHLDLAHVQSDDAFRAVAYRFRLLDGPERETWGERRPLILNEEERYSAPQWARDAIWYQIMIDRFRDGDPTNNPEYTTGTGRSEVTHPWTSPWYEEQPWEREDGATFWEWSMYDRLYGGDFQGVIDKLDYLEDLGVNAIYFNPVFEATTAHKYNAKSFIHADDGYGVPGEFARSVEREDMLNPETWEFNESDEKFLELVREIHARDMRVIIDGVWNHLGDNSAPFLDVQENLQDSAFADWFDIVSWEPFEYRGWAGFGGLPAFRKDAEKGLASESLREHIFAVTRRWMDPHGDGSLTDGIDGWRLDVPMEIPMPFWDEWAAYVREINPDAYIVGEVWDPAEEWLDGHRFDAVMNYQFAMAAFRFFGNVQKKTTTSEFDNELARLRIRYPRESTYVLQNLYDSHDTDRWVSRLANPDLEYDTQNRIQDTGPDFFDERPDPEYYRRMKLMALFQATYIGAPMIWYGTEVGMYGADDPRNRMPMWWEDMMPYEKEEYWIDEDVFGEFQALFALRSDEALLRQGEYRTILTEDEQDVFGFKRYAHDSDEGLIVLLNNSREPQEVTLGLPPGSIEIIYGRGSTGSVSEEMRTTFRIDPVAGAVFRHTSE